MPPALYVQGIVCRVVGGLVVPAVAQEVLSTDYIEASAAVLEVVWEEAAVTQAVQIVGTCRVL